MSNKKLFFFLVFAVLSTWGPILYFTSFFLHTPYRDIRMKPLPLFMVSPLPLVFDINPYFAHINLELFLTDNSKQSVAIDHDFTMNIDGFPHRKLHFMRTVNFLNYLDDRVWIPRAQKLLCDPFVLPYINIPKSEIDHIHIQTQYKKLGTEEIEFTNRDLSCKN